MLLLLACAAPEPSRFAQTVDGVPVFGAEAIVHPDGRVTDGFLDEVDVDTTPTLSADDARRIARLDAPADLQILRHDGVDHLTWRLRGRLDTPSLPVVFVDAHTGAIVWSYDNLQTASGTASYAGSVSIDTYKSGTKYYLEDTTRDAGTYSFGNTRTRISYVTDGDNKWTSDPVAVQAQYNAAVVLDYFADRFGRAGIDGAGGPGEVASLTGSGMIAASYVHYDEDYANAFWDGSAMTYGDGDGVDYGPFVALDIAGHEMTHGVTEFSAGLVYSGESGGLNESMSDVFGAMAERYADGKETSGTWGIGEEITWTGDAIRRLDDPASDGYSLDYYSSDAATADVHESSGIGNLAFYLVAEGGAHPRRGGASVTGIGADAAEQIWYRALTEYMTASTDYAGARAATLDAAAELYGSSSTEYAAVGQAWAAVGVGGTTVTGTLSGSGSYAYSDTFELAGAGKQTATLTGPSGADFNLYLQKYKGSSWTTVKSSTGSTSTESLTYSGRSGGSFRYKVKSASGSGAWSLAYTVP